MKKFYRYILPVMVFLSISNGSLLAQTSTYAYTGTVVTYTVPAGVLLASISAKGAQGGQGFGTGGTGAIMTGTFTVTPGHVLKILVGQQPTSTSAFAGGGGGGSFVWDATAGNLLLVAAGGGGGGGTSFSGVNAVTAINGTNGGGGALYGGAGTAGNGGVTPTSADHAAGGAGWLSNGANGNYPGYSAAGGGATPLSGGAGGAFGGSFVGYIGPGGFGGGGGGQGNPFDGFGGGGGGYSGGGGGAGPAASYYGGGGGGSFNGGSPQINSVGNTGNGQVIITPLCSPPVAGTITGSNTVCIGAVTTLYDTTGSIPSLFGTGTWSSNNLLLAEVFSTTGVVTGLSAGVDTITYTIVLSCGTTTVSRAITINPLPSAILGFSSLCPGSTDTLSDTTAGGAWSIAPTTVGTIGATNGVVEGIAAGLSTVSYTLASTGCASTRVITVGSIGSLISQVCDGDSLLATSTASGGIWTSYNPSLATVGSATGEVTGVGLGTATIAYTLPSGCTLSMPITVNALAPIAGIDSVCVGSNTYVTDIVGGGNWVSTVPSIATITSDSGRVFGVDTGSTTLIYTLPVTGCMTTTTFYVIGYPVAIIGPLKACPGTSTTLTDGTVGGWYSSGNTSVATIDTAAGLGVILGVAADTVDIYYTISPGCTVSTTITINPLPPPVVGASTICPNTKDSLSDPELYGLWSAGNPTIAVVDTYGVVTGINGGDGTIYYTNPVTGCQSAAVVTVDPLPAPVVTYNAYDVTLSVTPAGFASYQWYDSSEGLIPGANSPTIAASASGYYWVVVTDSGGCKGTSAVYNFDFSNVGVHNVINSNGVSIYPNPTNGILNIQSSVNVSANVTGLDGRTLLTADNVKEIDVTTLPAGLYFISVYDQSNNLITRQKFIKQ